MLNVIQSYFLNTWQVGKRPIFITGHGRSGTTWIGNTIAAARDALYYHEPGNPDINKTGDFDSWFKYLRPDQEDEIWEDIFNRVFQGMPGLGSRWGKVKWKRLLPGYQIVVKDVASLMAVEWIAKRFLPKILLVIRHPCAVILSELQKGTHPEDSMQAFLRQTHVFQDHLEKYRPIMVRMKTPETILAAIWAARHRVLADILPAYSDWTVVFYEDMCTSSIAKFKKLFQKLNLSWSGSVERYIVQSTTAHVKGTYSTTRITSRQADKWKTKAPDNVLLIKDCIEQFELPFYCEKHYWEL